MCHTAHVAFHEAFWIVTGTAAPVVALAAVVSMRDVNDYSYRRGLQLRALTEDVVANGIERLAVDEELQPAYLRLVFLGSLWVLQATNMCLQTALLAIALISIEQSANLLAPWIATTGTVVGLMLLAVTVVVEGNIKRMSAVIEEIAQERLRNRIAEAHSDRPSDAGV